MKELKSIYISLQASIAGLFSVVVFCLGLIIFFISYFTFDDLIIDFSTRALTNSTKTVELKLSNLLSPYSNYSNVTDNYYKNKQLDFEDKSEIRKYFLGIITANKPMYSIYVAKPNGSFFQIKDNLSKPGTYIEEDFNRDSSPETRTQRILDAEGNILDENVIADMSYDPRVRRWYIKAKGSEIPVWSSIYKFAIKQGREIHGITHSRSIINENAMRYVLGIDVETNELLDFIKKQKLYDSSIIYLIDSDGEILSSSSLEGNKHAKQEQQLIDDPKLLITYLNFKRAHNPVQRSVYDGIDYFAAYKQVEDLEGAKWTIGHIVDYSEISVPIRKLMVVYWIVMMITVVIAIFVALYISRKISKPINILAKKAKKLSQLESDDSVIPVSRIREIRSLSNAFDSMDAAIESFIKYMPTNLVKKLLKKQVIAEPGGENRVLSLMFLDFINFTTVSESMPPDQLMGYLSRYLECMTNVIHKYDGTIDKYIGDSIMAFWGAPGGSGDVNDNILKACKCILAMQKELLLHNEKIKKEGLPILQMRVGLHVGEMVVGNLGSSDKLNFTVIGDNVNLASRLEALCKYYHVNCIVSESIYSIVGKEFNFRFLDNVQVKGKTVPIKVFELVENIKYNEEEQKQFEQAFKRFQSGKWDEALFLFEELAKTIPEDYLIRVYINRIKERGNVPPEGWDGSWKMETK